VVGLGEGFNVGPAVGIDVGSSVISRVVVVVVVGEVVVGAIQVPTTVQLNWLLSSLQKSL